MPRGVRGPGSMVSQYRGGRIRERPNPGRRGRRSHTTLSRHTRPRPACRLRAPLIGVADAENVCAAVACVTRCWAAADALHARFRLGIAPGTDLRRRGGAPRHDRDTPMPTSMRHNTCAAAVNDAFIAAR